MCEPAWQGVGPAQAGNLRPVTLRPAAPPPTSAATVASHMPLGGAVVAQPAVSMSASLIHRGGWGLFSSKVMPNLAAGG